MLSRPRAQVSLRDGAVGGGAWCLDRGWGRGLGVEGFWGLRLKGLGVEGVERFWKWGARF